MKIYSTIKYLICFMLSLPLINQVQATNISDTITISDGYIKASIPGSDVTAAYMTLNNVSGKEITLQKVTGHISERIEIHEHSMANGMMSMREVGNIIIAAKDSVVLQPSGLHLMIFSVKQPLKENEVIPLTLHLSDQSIVNIQLPVYRYK